MVVEGDGRGAERAGALQMVAGVYTGVSSMDLVLLLLCVGEGLWVYL